MKLRKEPKEPTKPKMKKKFTLVEPQEKIERDLNGTGDIEIPLMKYLERAKEFGVDLKDVLVSYEYIGYDYNSFEDVCIGFWEDDIERFERDMKNYERRHQNWKKKHDKWLEWYEENKEWVKSELKRREEIKRQKVEKARLAKLKQVEKELAKLTKLKEELQ